MQRKNNSWTGGTGSRQKRGPVLVAGTVLIALVLVAFLLLDTLRGGEELSVSNSGSDTAGQDPAGQTTSPDELLENLESELAQEGETDEGYTGVPMPPEVYTELFGKQNSGLDSATYDQLSNLGRQLVTADVTREGRQNFPDYWIETPVTTALANPFTVDFAGATAVAGYPNLVRTVVIWNGTTWDGNRIAQMRVADYWERQGGNRYRPLKTEEIPPLLVRRDPLVDGVSVRG